MIGFFKNHKVIVVIIVYFLIIAIATTVFLLLSNNTNTSINTPPAPSENHEFQPTTDNNGETKYVRQVPAIDPNYYFEEIGDVWIIDENGVWEQVENNSY